MDASGSGLCIPFLFGACPQPRAEDGGRDRLHARLPVGAREQHDCYATIMAHATSNATILLSAFLPLESVEAAAAVVTVVVTIPLLVLLIRAVSQPSKMFQEKL